jgi:RNA polymerase sigma-70 factor (ECF subfamily)
MAIDSIRSALHHLRRTAWLHDNGTMTDGQLLECFRARRDEVAFEILVRRHGPMVFGVCRRLLATEQDAEDAFQATFLVLAHKAASVVPPELVGNWLHGVAHRTAMKMQVASARRRGKERQVQVMPDQAAELEDVWHDVQPLLDRELGHLPGKYRASVVLCDLEGRSRREAAQQLGIPEGTLSSRLATARKMLARRLARRGVGLGAGSLALVLSQKAASAGVPAALVEATVKAAPLFAAGQVPTGVVSAHVVALTEGVLKGILLTKFKVAAVLVLALGVFGAGVGLVVSRTGATPGNDNRLARHEQKADALPRPVLPKQDPRDDPPKVGNEQTPENQEDAVVKNG